MNNIPKNELYVQSHEVQEALVVSEGNYKRGNYKKFSDVDKLITELDNG